MKLAAIGAVRNRIRKPDHHRWREVVSRIVIEPGLEPALDGLEGFSHAIVIFWMNALPRASRKVLSVYPMGDEGIPPKGVFATRSPARPNPLGMTVVELRGRRKNVLTIAGLDAINGTPVIDIKPYVPGHDVPKGARIPSWLKEAERRHQH
jgi:tRNA-Thr(GGU) m(6)t(6)A37 methyltransferase TsaA